MNISAEMAPVMRCRVTECAYNRDQACHAKGITVGDMENAACDTFFMSERHAMGAWTSGVGACKVDVCQYNSDYHCTAKSIEVAPAQDKADCMTFTRKEVGAGV